MTEEIQAHIGSNGFDVARAHSAHACRRRGTPAIQNNCKTALVCCIEMGEIFRSPLPSSTSSTSSTLCRLDGHSFNILQSILVATRRRPFHPQSTTIIHIRENRRTIRIAYFSLVRYLSRVVSVCVCVLYMRCTKWLCNSFATSWKIVQEENSRCERFVDFQCWVHTCTQTAAVCVWEREWHWNQKLCHKKSLNSVIEPVAPVLFASRKSSLWNRSIRYLRR